MANDIQDASISEPRLGVIPLDLMKWRDLDDGSVVFHRMTGETHFFNLYATFILRCLQEDPMTEAALVRRIYNDLGEPEDDALRGKVHRQILNFVEMAIVEVVSS